MRNHVDCNLDALHASLIRLISLYIQKPNSVKVDAVIRILNALSTHPERKLLSTEYDPYKEALKIWSELTSNKSTKLSYLKLVIDEDIILH